MVLLSVLSCGIASVLLCPEFNKVLSVLFKVKGIGFWRQYYLVDTVFKHSSKHKKVYNYSKL